MIDFTAINKISNTNLAYAKNSEKLIFTFNSGLQNIDKFNNSSIKYEKKYLVAAAINFSDCLKIKSSFAEAYLGLAYVFFITDDIHNAFKHINLADGFAPKSNIIKQLKEKIENKMKV